MYSSKPSFSHRRLSLTNGMLFFQLQLFYGNTTGSCIASYIKFYGEASLTSFRSQKYPPENPLTEGKFNSQYYCMLLNIQLLQTIVLSDLNRNNE